METCFIQKSNGLSCRDGQSGWRIVITACEDRVVRTSAVLGVYQTEAEYRDGEQQNVAHGVVVTSWFFQ